MPATKISLYLVILFAAPLAGLASDPSDGLPPQAMVGFAEVENLFNSMKLKEAEARAREIVAKHPLHPLPGIFLQSALLDAIQEDIAAGKKDAELFARFEKACEETLEKVRLRLEAKPDARAYLYLGGTLGARGLVKLYQGRYLAAHGDGQEANKALRKALELEGDLYEAYVGLGQYAYYSGRLGKILRFFLSMEGSEEEGIRLLEACGAHPSYAALSARQCLARIYTREALNFEKALPYAEEFYRRYPENPTFFAYAREASLGALQSQARARDLAEALCGQWEGGWRPPAYVSVDMAGLRLALAQLYLAEGVPEKARPHLQALALQEHARAIKLLAALPLPAETKP